MSKLLFVDDDASLLRALDRSLRFDYELQLAESGEIALDMLRGDNSTAVIVTDMEMPGMDGLQFIEQARQIAPHSIYLMLTGNQDFDTAIAAVNDGSVFRFLSKPCPIAAIKRAVGAAFQQRELLYSERELLERTCVGAVDLLSDVIESVKPELLDHTRRVDGTMQSCEGALGGAGSYEYRLAAKLGLLGFALMPQIEQDNFRRLRPSNPASQLLLTKFMETSSRLVGRIPRLAPVAELLASVPQADMLALHGTAALSSPAVGAALLKLAILWNVAIHKESSASNALRQLSAAVPDIPPVIESVLLASGGDCEREPVVWTKLHELREGMLLRHNVMGVDGRTLIRAGLPLTQTIIEKLKLHEGTLDHVKFAVDPEYVRHAYVPAGAPV